MLNLLILKCLLSFLFLIFFTVSLMEHFLRWYSTSTLGCWTRCGWISTLASSALSYSYWPLLQLTHSHQWLHQTSSITYPCLISHLLIPHLSLAQSSSVNYSFSISAMSHGMKTTYSDHEKLGAGNDYSIKNFLYLGMFKYYCSTDWQNK